MKRLLLLLTLVLCAHGLFAQVMPITGGGPHGSLCIGTSYTLNDADAPLGYWSSSAPSIATIGSSTGIVTGISSGVVTISYNIYPIYAVATFTVNASPGPITTTASTICIGSNTTVNDPTGGGRWTSSALGVANVGTSSGIVHGVAAGTTNITYTVVNTGCYTTTPIVVNSVAISGPNVACLGAGSITLIDATAGGTWSSSSPSIATIDAGTGTVTPVTAGNTTITYNDGPGCIATELITVRPVPTISPNPINACVGASATAVGTPSGGSWATTTPAVATVNFVGVVTGVSSGTTTLDYIAPGGCLATASVIVNTVPSVISGPTYVYSGSTITLGDATGGGVWSSANATLATVTAAGVVTGVSAGLVDIVYTLPSTGCDVTYRIEVNPMPATANLEAWWPFCGGDTADYSLPVGGPYTLLNHGSLAIPTVPAVRTTDRFGAANNAYMFGGNSAMYYSSYLPVSGVTGDFTYSVWINPTAGGATPQSAIIAYNGNPNSDGYGFVMDNGTFGTAGTNISVLIGGVGEFLSTPIATLNTTILSAPSPDGWFNLMLVKNGGSYRFYVGTDNGNYATVGFFIPTPVYNPMSAGSLFSLGYNTSGGAFGPSGFQGAIDDITVIDRQLSNAERLSLLNFNPDAQAFSLGNDTTICSDIMTLAPNPQTIGSDYTWESLPPAGGYTVLNTSDTVLEVYPNAGSNVYSLVISKPYGCTSKDTIVVTKSPIPVNLGPDLKLCLGDTVTLFNNFPHGVFLWSTGDTSHSIKVATNGNYYVTVDSEYYFTNVLTGLPDSTTCVGRDTVKINFYAVPVLALPSFISNCLGNPYTLVEYYDPAYTYRWIDGTNKDSLIVTTSGQYWVRVTDTGCVRYDTTNVTIVYDTLTFTMPNVQICKADPATAISTVGFVTNNFVANYQWTPSAGISLSNTYDPVIYADTSATYTLTVSYPGCADIVDSFHIDVEPTPTKVSIGVTNANIDICMGDTMHLTANVFPNWYTGYTYSWSPGFMLDDSTVQTVVLTGKDTTKMVVTVSTPAGCTYADSIEIYTHPGYYDSLAGTQYDLCPGDSVQLLVYDTLPGNSGTITNNWTPSVYLSDSTAVSPWVHPITSQDYTLIATSQYGCKDTLTVRINVHPAAVIYMPDSAIIYPGDSYEIPTQTNCVNFTWFPPLGLNDVHLSNPTANPTTHTTYQVHATTEAGCAIDDSIIIHVDPYTLLGIPNAFAPGNGPNSYFKLIPRGAVSLNYFHIFDRWGVEVFDTKNINEGWDGKYKGVPQPFGVYVYELEAVSVTGELYIRTGNITLIR